MYRNRLAGRVGAPLRAIVASGRRRAISTMIIPQFGGGGEAGPGGDGAGSSGAAPQVPLGFRLPPGMHPEDVIEIRTPAGVYRAPAADRLAAAARSAPPASNTGVRDTGAFCDWLSATAQEDPETVLRWLTPSSASLSDWVTLHHGGLGYRVCVQRGHLRVYSDGAPGMGVHFSLSGQAVRQVEQEFRLFTQEAWRAWLSLMRERGCRFTRVDAAMDDLGPEGLLSMAAIEEAARSRCLVSLFRTCEKRRRDMWELAGEGRAEVLESGETLYFGSRSSDMFVRIYDKAAQQGEAFHHVRVEVEAKNGNAEELVTRIIAEGFKVVPQVLRAYLDFKTPGETKNKSRWETAPWWDAFLCSAEKARLRVVRAAARTLETVKAWLNRQAAQSLAVVLDAIHKECQAAGLDVRRAQRRYVYGLVEEGRSRYRSKHRIMLSGHVPALGEGLV